MLQEQEQRILGYFIEEAKDHLNTIEQGLLNLEDTLQDSETVNEVFRAAHSIKGGAAMLGLDSIQKISHHLEDYFKVLKECPEVEVDQKLESLFLALFDTLKELIEELIVQNVSHSFGFSDILKDINFKLEKGKTYPLTTYQRDVKTMTDPSGESSISISLGKV